MEQFEFIARGNTSTRDKLKIYLSAHPDDLAMYFDLITDDILAAADAVIRYTRSEPSCEELEYLLSDVGAMVIPVTRRYLTEPSVARDIERPMAAKMSVPTLPIILEEGLTELFNSTFDDIQYLDRTSTDATAIAYDRKLAAYLSGIGPSDSLVKKIKEEFDTGIFLSYRKKDRAYARELIRLIHKNEFCRDVSIWYDEYLTPGENFNEEIRAALEECKVFAMAVTPNLINERNYVMEHEFPMARDSEKPIIPAELVATDRGELERLYERIPTTVSPSELENALRATLSDYISFENDHSPEHLYYIGLAYLMGIDVETDYERAVALITEAADNGFTLAQKKLSRMYYTGEGVGRNVERAIELRLSIARGYDEGFRSDTLSLEELFEYFFNMYEICKMLLESSPSATDEYAFSRTLAIAERMYYDMYADDDGALSLAKAHKAYGDYMKILGEPIKARERYELSLEALAHSFDPESNDEVFALYMQCYVSLSDGYVLEARYDDAEKSVMAAIALSETMEENTGLNRIPIARAYFSFAHVQHLRGRHRAAIELFDRSIAMYHTIRVKNSPTLAVHELLLAYKLRSVSNSILRRHARAREDVADARALLDSVREGVGDLADFWDATLDVVEARLLIERFRLTRAKKMLDAVLERLKSDTGEGMHPENKEQITLECYESYAQLYNRKFRLDLADEYNIRILEIRTANARERGRTEDYLELADCYRELRHSSGGFGGREWKTYAIIAQSKELVFLEDGERQDELADYREEKRGNLATDGFLALTFSIAAILIWIFGGSLGIDFRLSSTIAALLFLLRFALRWNNYTKCKELFTLPNYDPVSVIGSVMKKRQILNTLGLVNLLLLFIFLGVSGASHLALGGVAWMNVYPELYSAVLVIPLYLQTLLYLFSRDMDIDRHRAFMYLGRISLYQ